MIVAGYPQRTLVAYRISGAELRRGRSLTNWIACRQFPERTLPPKEDWSRVGRLEVFTDAYESWTFDWLDVPAVTWSALSWRDENALSRRINRLFALRIPVANRSAGENVCSGHCAKCRRWSGRDQMKPPAAE
jgi:hypothetical protein